MIEGGEQMEANKWNLFDREFASLCNGGNSGLLSKQTNSKIKYTALLQKRTNLVATILVNLCLTGC